MTVLRSRKIVSTVESQSPFKAAEMEAIVPATPSKTLEEPLSQVVCNTPSSSDSIPIASSMGLGSDSVSGLGGVVRRSLRLASASVLSLDEVTPSVKVSSRKRKNLFAENCTKQNNKYASDSGERGSEVVIENQITDFQVSKVRVSDRIRMKNRGRGEWSMEVEGEEKVETGEKKLDSSNDSVVDVPIVGRGAIKCASPSVSSNFIRDSGKVKGMRKLDSGVDLMSLQLVREDCSAEGVFELRSGKKVTKRIMEGDCGFVSLVQVESDNGEKLRNLNGRGDEDKTSGIELYGVSGKCILTDKSVKVPAIGEIGTLRSKKRFSGSLVIEGVDALKTVKLETDCKEKISAGNEASATINLAGNDGLTELDKGKMVEDELLSNGTAISYVVHFPKKEGQELNKDQTTNKNSAVKARRRLTVEEKGKGKVVGDGLLPNSIDWLEMGLEPEVGNSTKKEVSSILGAVGDVLVQDERQSAGIVTGENVTRERVYRERFRDIARQNASRFAHYPSQEVEENHDTDMAGSEMLRREADSDMEDWPGPFSTALKIIKDRAVNVNVPQQGSCLQKSKSTPVLWVPKKDQHRPPSIPRLQELCMPILCKYANSITSLAGVPDEVRHKLCQLLCDSRRMNSHFLDLLVQGSPVELRIRDCSWLSEEEFTRTFQGCETSNLMVLQLDQCGRCMPDYVLSTTLARFPNGLPALTAISLKGACRLSDAGLSALVASAPALRSINLGQCSLLTSDGINTLANSLGSVLRELYIDDFQITDAMLILPALSKLEYLEVLSVAGIESVCDDFVSKFIAVRGHNIKELVLTDCTKLTDSSLRVISETCTGLCSLDLANLRKLTDSTLGYLADGCRAIQTLKFCRNSFSDEAVGAYLEASGESLTELSLNNVNKVGENTAISLARHSRKLFSLDVSWCRKLTDEALGLIVDSCLSLKVLKLFGCTQITNVFLDGHSNPHVQIIGLKMTPFLTHLKLPDPLQGPLHYSSVSSWQ